MFREHYNPKIITNPILVVAGGVAANQSLRDQLQSLAKEKRLSIVEIERAPSLDWIRPFQEPYPKQGAQYVKAIVGPPSGQE